MDIKGTMLMAGGYGLLGITKSSAKALGPKVRVNTFAPGFMETEALLGPTTGSTMAIDPDGGHVRQSTDQVYERVGSASAAPRCAKRCVSSRASG